MSLTSVSGDGERKQILHASLSRVRGVGALHCLLRNLNLHDVVLIGLSMGGRTVLEYGLEHGERLKSMIVVGPVGDEEHIVSPLAMSDILLREISDTQRVVFAGAPHPCYQDQPDNRHAALETFLQSIETC